MAGWQNKPKQASETDTQKRAEIYFSQNQNNKEARLLIRHLLQHIQAQSMPEDFNKANIFILFFVIISR